MHCDAFRSPTDHFFFWGGGKILNIIFGKVVIFWGVHHDPNDAISTHMNKKRMPNSQSAQKITPGGKQLPKNGIYVIKGQ